MSTNGTSVTGIHGSQNRGFKSGRDIQEVVRDFATRIELDFDVVVEGIESMGGPLSQPSEELLAWLADEAPLMEFFLVFPNVPKPKIRDAVRSCFRQTQPQP